MSLLRERDPELFLRNAHRLLRKLAQYRGHTLWQFVSEITSHGSTLSHQICRELHWNPDALVREDLPPYVGERTSINADSGGASS